MGRHAFSAVLSVLLLLGIGTTLHAQQSDAESEYRQQVMGVLEHARVDLSLDGVPVRDALEQLSAVIGIAIVGRYTRIDEGYGIDPEQSVSIHAVDVRAIDALEMIVDQAALFASCSWQLRHGMIEVGTKKRLCLASEPRQYPIGDFLFDPSYGIAAFKATPFGLKPNPEALHPEWYIDFEHFDEHPYRAASLKCAGETVDNYKFIDGIRYSRSNLLDEFTRALVEVIEPGNWDFTLHRQPITGARSTESDDAYRSSEHRVASVRAFRDELMVVRAPDFMHRQIGWADPPADVNDAALRDRSVPRPFIQLSPVEPEPVESEGVFIRGLSSRQEFHDVATDRLLNTPVTIEFQAIPAREAFAQLGALINLPIIARCDDDALGFGIDADARITLIIRDLPAMDVLTIMLAECERPDAPCTWQIRRGYVEVSTKARLSVPAARELRLYHIRDLMYEPQDFGPGGSYKKKRKLSIGLALDQVEAVVTNVEPDAWDWGQIDHYSTDDPNGPLTPNVPGAGQAPDGGRGDRDGASTGRRPRAYYVEPPRPAIIRHWQDVLIVSAPDFIHRQIGAAIRTDTP